MESPASPQPVFPRRVTSPSGLSFELNSNGTVRRIDHGDIMLNLFPGSETEGGPAGIHLRVLGGTPDSVPLTGPGSPAVYQHDAAGMSARGEWRGLVFRLRLSLAESASAWFWHVEVENTTDRELACDLILTQDLGLAHYGAIRLNEYYVSQYVDHVPLHHARTGVAVASRQNQSMGGRFPWCVTGTLGRALSFATDAYQFHGLATRAGRGAPALASGLPGKRLQHEHSMACVQDEPFTLPPGGRIRRGFFGLFVPDHPAATTAEDAGRIDGVLALPEASCPPWPDAGGVPAAASCFAPAMLLESLDLGEAEIRGFFEGEPRHVEASDDGWLSFFTGENRHVVLKRKETRVLRPHGHLLRSGGSLTADETALASTAWMNGVFHSMVTQGHVSINRFLSTCHTYLGLFRSHGQRVFAEIGGAWRLLDLPSAFSMEPDRCRWIYQHDAGVIEVVSSAPDDRHALLLEIRVLKGDACRFLISHHVAMNGDDGSTSIPAVVENRDGGLFVRSIPDCDVGRRFPNGGFLIKTDPDTLVESSGGDELLFADGVSRGQPFVCLVTRPALRAGLSIEGRLVEAPAAHLTDFWKTLGLGLRIEGPAASPLAPAAGEFAEIFPWFAHNALVHYLSPRGLEQYSGGGWGTRDVCQGPVELLLGIGRPGPLRDILLRVFRQQNADGDWPQWFMFFERERNIRPGDSHGDIVYWPLVALAQYLAATGDASLLEESVPYFHPDGGAAAENASVWRHVERALEVILNRVIAGTNLAAYGHGDWNDSLQPARPDMRERLCSSWTVTLNYQTFVTLAAALRDLGRNDKAAELEAMAANILDEFQRVLVVDDVVTGLAYFHEGGKTDHLLHPRDGVTGLSYSLLPMIHAIINDMFTPRQAEVHLAVIRDHLLGPDGAHLFDRPMAYRGGIQTNFQRAESASFFGREIGIMYTHAHLRYCEALARHGDADEFFHALCQANPIALRDLAPCATLRQSNCYYSSSDPVFADRYEAYENYDRVMRGEVPLEGGWRVYSSGAGIGTRLIMQCFLGIRIGKSALILDPVVPASLDGMKASLDLAGKRVKATYRVRKHGRGPVSVNLNGADLDFVHEPNAYRTGAARVSMDAFQRELTEETNLLTIWLE